MLITRCAWHRGYHGHPALIGITDWRGLRLGFSDGICSQCAAQLRADVPGAPLTDPTGVTDVAGWMPGAGLVTIAVMLIVLFAARPVHEPAEDQWVAELVSAEQPQPADESRAADPRQTAELARAADLPRTAGVVAERAVEPRSGHAAQRHAHPRGGAPVQPRPGRDAATAARAPSQAP